LRDGALVWLVLSSARVAGWSTHHYTP